MRPALLAIGVALALAACGGKAKDAAEPGADPTCCCSSSEGREVIGETACQERGGSCDPAETCEADESAEPAGDNDPDDY